MFVSGSASGGTQPETHRCSVEEGEGLGSPLQHTAGKGVGVARTGTGFLASQPQSPDL